MSWLKSINKAWVISVVSFLSMQAAHWTGYTISSEVQNAIVSIIFGIIVWATPNVPRK